MTVFCGIREIYFHDTIKNLIYFCRKICHYVSIKSAVQENQQLERFKDTEINQINGKWFLAIFCLYFRSYTDRIPCFVQISFSLRWLSFDKIIMQCFLSWHDSCLCAILHCLIIYLLDCTGVIVILSPEDSEFHQGHVRKLPVTWG